MRIHAKMDGFDFTLSCKYLKDYVVSEPMFRVENGKLYYVMFFCKNNQNPMNNRKKFKPEYWCMVGAESGVCMRMLFKTHDEDYVIGDLVDECEGIDLKHFYTYVSSKYYWEIMRDVENDDFPIVGEIKEELKNKEDFYDLKQIDNDIEQKICFFNNELLQKIYDLKYDKIFAYYEYLFNSICRQYRDNKYIDMEKIILCSRLMRQYYGGVIGIHNFFNIEQYEVDHKKIEKVIEYKFDKT